MNYLCLKNQTFSKGNFKIVPIRFDDRFKIMNWRNEQIKHLRQSAPLTDIDQDNYFKNVVSKLFDQEKPNQLLFSYLENEVCIGYGGLVHINWIDKHAEISFIMDSALEEKSFDFHWSTYLNLIETVAFDEIQFHKIYTYAFDIRPHLYKILEDNLYFKDATLKEHCLYNDTFIDVVIHAKINNKAQLKKARSNDLELTFEWATNPVIRQHSFKKDPIRFEEHKEWFLKKISNPDCKYYILYKGDNLIGSIRFDIEKDNKALISYLIDPMYQGKGFGKLILEQGTNKLKLDKPQIEEIYGSVFKNNIPSMKIFEALGFIISEDKEESVIFIKNI